ncbi:hypothetical protein VNO78_04829 [Psophocarpus tetragonolobus]|uniref:Uncharacterized protein n=1 Tax=Psophocarpus tetragonolobus TaxID=3891 RepID=A0AAN9XXQ9_PSOTE
MSKGCSLHAILLLLSTLGALMAMVVGDRCKNDLGVCHDIVSCKYKCSKAHEGGKGICENNGVKKHSLIVHPGSQTKELLVIVLPYQRPTILIVTVATNAVAFALDAKAFVASVSYFCHIVLSQSVAFAWWLCCIPQIWALH